MPRSPDSAEQKSGYQPVASGGRRNMGWKRRTKALARRRWVRPLAAFTHNPANQTRQATRNTCCCKTVGFRLGVPSINPPTLDGFVGRAADWLSHALRWSTRAVPELHGPMMYQMAIWLAARLQKAKIHTNRRNVHRDVWEVEITQVTVKYKNQIQKPYHASVGTHHMNRTHRAGDKSCKMLSKFRSTT